MQLYEPSVFYNKTYKRENTALESQKVSTQTLLHLNTFLLKACTIKRRNLFNIKVAKRLNWRFSDEHYENMQIWKRENSALYLNISYLCTIMSF